MKNKVFTIIFLIILILSIGTIVSQAKVVTNDPTVKSGETVTINVTSQELVDGYKISISSNEGLTFISAEGGTLVDGQIVSGVYTSGVTNLAVYKFQAPEVTKDTTYKVTFSAEGVIPHGTDEKTSNQATATVTVKAKETVPETPPTTTTPETPTTPSTPATTTPTTPEEPTFTSVNETVYAKQTVNIRESYTTSSKILGSLQKGKEVTRTGVGSNGWSKVTYNGKTAYISSSYLTTTKPVEEEKSNNANLKSLEVDNQELVPSFSTNTVAYTMQVANTITELNIKAEPEDEKATVSIQGNKNLKEGENLVTISVSAEDGTVKIYEIQVTRLKEMTLGLASLKIEDTNIDKQFKSDLYQYEITIKEKTQLEIEAVANDEKATVEIIGNENLEEGENVITIIVTSQDGNEKVTYQIKAKKLATNIAGTTEENKKIDSNLYIYIAVGAVLLIALVIVIVYTIKHRNQEEYENEEFEGFPEELPEKQENILNHTEKIENNATKSKIDYFLENDEEENRNRNRKGKHF